MVPGDIGGVQPRHLDLIWQVDLRGPLLMVRSALPHMRTAGGGHIINVSSGAARMPGPGPDAQRDRSGAPTGISIDLFYGMVKAGLDRVTQGLAMDLQASNIAVNCLSPQGAVRTPGYSFADNDPEHPLEEFESADTMGQAAVWICEQPPQSYTGNIAFDRDLLRAQGLPA